MIAKPALDTNGHPVGEIPAEVILGKIPGQWPVQIFTHQAHAVTWYEDQKDKKPKLWLAKLIALQEMNYVPPGDAKLEVRTDD